MRSLSLTALGALLAAAVAAQQPAAPGAYRAPSDHFAASVGCDSAQVASHRKELLARIGTAHDTSTTLLSTACDALAWLGRPDSYDYQTVDGSPAQEVWHYDHDILPPPTLEPQGPGRPWMLTPPLNDRPPRR
jgi:hypothetical protein